MANVSSKVMNQQLKIIADKLSQGYTDSEIMVELPNMSRAYWVFIHIPDSIHNLGNQRPLDLLDYPYPIMTHP